MTRTATAETRQKMSEAKLGVNHPLYGKTREDETRAKISKTLSEKGAAERAELNGSQYIKRVVHADRTGYKVTNHPTLKDKLKATTIKNPSEAVLKAKYDECVAYLATATGV